MGKYVDNKRLKEVVSLYNSLNAYDTGDWCPKYLENQEKRLKSGKITKDDYIKCKEFIHRKVKQIEDLQDKYQKLTLEERRKYDYEFDKLKDEFCDMIIKIANGRVNSFKLRSQPNLVNHIDDIMQDAVIQVFRYINRFDESRGTSAFSYVTEQCSNAIKQDLKKIQEHDKTYVSGIDFFDNINTIDNPHDGVSGLANFME